MDAKRTTPGVNGIAREPDANAMAPAPRVAARPNIFRTTVRLLKHPRLASHLLQHSLSRNAYGPPDAPDVCPMLLPKPLATITAEMPRSTSGAAGEGSSWCLDTGETSPLSPSAKDMDDADAGCSRACHWAL